MATIFIFWMVLLGLVFRVQSQLYTVSTITTVPATTPLPAGHQRSVVNLSDGPAGPTQNSTQRAARQQASLPSWARWRPVRPRTGSYRDEKTSAEDDSFAANTWVNEFFHAAALVNRTNDIVVYADYDTRTGAPINGSLEAWRTAYPNATLVPQSALDQRPERVFGRSSGLQSFAVPFFDGQPSSIGPSVGAAAHVFINSNAIFPITAYNPCPYYCPEFQTGTWPGIHLFNTDLDPGRCSNHYRDGDSDVPCGIWIDRYVYSSPTDGGGIPSASSPSSTSAAAVTASVVVTFENVPIYGHDALFGACNLTAQAEFFPNGTVILRYLSLPTVRDGLPAFTGLRLSPDVMAAMERPKNKAALMNASQCTNDLNNINIVAARFDINTFPTAAVIPPPTPDMPGIVRRVGAAPCYLLGDCGACAADVRCSWCAQSLTAGLRTGRCVEKALSPLMCVPSARYEDGACNASVGVRQGVVGSNNDYYNSTTAPLSAATGPDALVATLVQAGEQRQRTAWRLRNDTLPAVRYSQTAATTRLTSTRTTPLAAHASCGSDYPSVYGTARSLTDVQSQELRLSTPFPMFYHPDTVDKALRWADRALITATSTGFGVLLKSQVSGASSGRVVLAVGADATDAMLCAGLPTNITNATVLLLQRVRGSDVFEADVYVLVRGDTVTVAVGQVQPAAYMAFALLRAGKVPFNTWYLAEAVPPQSPMVAVGGGMLAPSIHRDALSMQAAATGAWPGTITTFQATAACPVCLYGGVCDKLQSRCVCPRPLAGRVCESCIDGYFTVEEGRCSACPACRNGVCNKTSGRCDCSRGFSGLLCDVVCGQVEGQCSAATCNFANGYCLCGSCACKDGWEGPRCDDAADDGLGGWATFTIVGVSVLGPIGCGFTCFCVWRQIAKGPNYGSGEAVPAAAQRSTVPGPSLCVPLRPEDIKIVAEGVGSHDGDQWTELLMI